MNLEWLFLKSLISTIVIETGVLFLLFRLFDKTNSVKTVRIAFTGVFASFATLPYLWFLLPAFLHNTTLYVLVSELSAFLVESLIIKALTNTTFKRSLLFSFICNATSFLIGLVLFN